MPSDTVLEVWRNATACADAPEHFSKSTLEKHLPKLFEQEHFSGIEKSAAGRARAVRALWDERGDATAIIEAVVVALQDGVKTFAYVRGCLKRVPGSDTVDPSVHKHGSKEAAGDQGTPPDSPGKGPDGPAASEPSPEPPASPQLENGYLRIAHEVWAQLMRADLRGSELRVVFAVLRQTWGWNRKQAEISLEEFCALTLQQERTVAKALRSLLGQNLLTVSKGGGRGVKSNWVFNKNWRSWKTLPVRAENINTVHKGRVNELNSALNGSDTLPNETEINTRKGRVSGCNSLPEQEQLPPKESFKDKRKKEPPIVPQPDLPPAVKLTASSLFEIWNSEGGDLRKITTYMTQLLKVEDLVQFFNQSQQNGKGPVQRWTEFVQHAAETIHEEHRGFIEPVWIAKNLIHVDDLLAGKYSHSFKGESHGKGSGSRKGNRSGNRKDFKSTGRGIISPGKL